MTRQFAWLLAAVAGTFVVFAVMPSPLALGVALVVGGATIAPALTLENTLVGRIAPAGMLNEAYTWVVTVSVAASAAGGAVAGLIVDHAGGVPWAFVFAGAAVAVGAAVAALPAGPDRPRRKPRRYAPKSPPRLTSHQGCFQEVGVPLPRMPRMPEPASCAMASPAAARSTD